MDHPPPSESVITLTNVKKSFSHEVVLKNINLSFKRGSFTCILGPSGCGKSTLLRLLNGLETLDSGSITIDQLTLSLDQPAMKEAYKLTALQVRQSVGMVFQSFQLFPHLTLLENVSKPLIIVKKMIKDNAILDAHAYLEKVGLSEHHHKYPYQLSGGQQQRGAIARALALKPTVMLYDEPTSALDPGLVGEVHLVMKNIGRDNMTQIIVTHEMRFARDVADTIVFMDKGEVVEVNSSKQFFANPETEAAREFLRNFL